ncbi:hypothetical protein AAG906_004122 [Vitis piasezkii]
MFGSILEETDTLTLIGVSWIFVRPACFIFCFSFIGFSDEPTPLTVHSSRPPSVESFKRFHRRKPPGTIGSACVEVMTTLHGSALSLWRCAEGCVPSEGMIASTRDSLNLQSRFSSDRFSYLRSSLLYICSGLDISLITFGLPFGIFGRHSWWSFPYPISYLTRLGGRLIRVSDHRRIDGQQTQQASPQDDTEVASPSVTVPTSTSEDPHARMDRLEQRLKQLRTSDRDVSRCRTWNDLTQEFLRQFAFNTVIDVSRRDWSLHLSPAGGRRFCMPSMGKKPLGGQRLGYVVAINSVGLRPPRCYQTAVQTSTLYYPPSPRHKEASCFIFCHRDPKTVFTVGMPLSQALRKLKEDESELEPIVSYEIFEIGRVTLGPQMSTPFRLVPKAASVQMTIVKPLTFPHYSVQMPFVLIPCVDEVQTPYIDDVQTSNVQYVICGGRVVRQQLPATARPLEGTFAHEEVKREDDEILRHTHRDALIRALSQIRVETTTTPKGLIHMVTVGRTNCIVLSDDDLPPDGPTTFPTLFQVLRIPTSFNLLLGRPWIHRAEAILYSLHQKVKFIHDGQLSDGALGTSASVLAAPSSPDRVSLMTFYFSDEVDEHGTFVKIEDIVDGTVQCEEYIDEMLVMSMSQIDGIVQPELASPFDLFGVSAIKVVKEVQTTPTSEFSDDVILEASDFVDPPLSFDVLSGFVFRFDDRVSPARGDAKIVDFGTTDRPRELRIRLDLSTDERDGLTWLLISYLDVFAWSNEDIPGLDPSIVKEEIQKHLSVGFLSVVEYPEWLAIVVPIPKKDDKVRASPEDDFHLPQFDMLVDSTTSHSMLSFMNEFFGVMPFGLKNAGATYQRVATTLFYDMMHRDVKFILRLNPKKCIFGVAYGKLLGYMVSERGIEADPDKIRAILDMPAPRTEREIRGFLGRLQKSQPIVWDDKCQCAFERIREYLLSPPILVPPTLGHSLLLYLSISNVALGCMLAQLNDSGKKKAIYYLSKRMLDYETRYVMIELRHYMTEYSVHLISRLDPLRYLFDRPALVGRLMRWLVLLNGFDIHYVTQKSIRGSIVADHLASLPVSDGRTIDDDFPDKDVAVVTSLLGVLLISPHGDHIPRYVRLAFLDQHPATNNIVEYEACILGLETTLELEIRQMKVFGDSNLVLRQI